MEGVIGDILDQIKGSAMGWVYVLGSFGPGVAWVFWYWCTTPAPPQSKKWRHLFARPAGIRETSRRHIIFWVVLAALLVTSSLFADWFYPFVPPDQFIDPDGPVLLP